MAVALFYVLLLLAFIDWDTMRLPNLLLLVLLGVGIAGLGASQLLGATVVPLLSSGKGLWSKPIVSATIGALSASGIMLAISLTYRAIRGKQGYGMGDIKLLAVVGVFLGPYSLMAMFLATVMGAAYGVASARSSGEGGQHRVPFGPFIALAAVIVALVGPQLWAWYAGLAYMSL
jgi:leader peptidase (prepilin peptidase) / N-methyltransferase